jgi:hypothetical protein
LYECFLGGKELTLETVAWDVTANVSFGRHYGFIDQEKDVDNLITDSTKGLFYFAPVRKKISPSHKPKTNLNSLTYRSLWIGLPNPMD